jgi:hypothetical protein
MSLELTQRTQYTFKVDDCKIARLLTLNVKPDRTIVNVVGITIIAYGKKKLVKIVVGTDDPNNSKRGGAGDPTNPDPSRTNELQNKQFRRNMKTLGIKWTKDTVIQIFSVQNMTGTPGVYRIFYSALVCADINILAFYLGEPALKFPLVTCTCENGDTNFESEVISVFIQVAKCQLKKAKRVLLSIDETKLCVNTHNVLKNTCCKSNF